MAGENLNKLVALMATLRGPEGCPWDRAQNYDSVKGMLLEEAYEVVDAVTARDFDGLKDELGDLLFQVVFYSQLTAEDAQFDIDAVIEHAYAKLVRRHPHVFGERKARDAGEALASWNRVKEDERAAQEKAQGSTPSLLDGIHKTLPSTLEAYEIGVRAAEAGFDWVRVEDLLDKIGEEVTELRHELAGSASTPDRPARVEDEVGDLLFAAANLARFVGSDPESCLRRANHKFKRRFRALEQEVVAQGRKVRECSLEELEQVWSKVKKEEARVVTPAPPE
jgi:MazG family protein